MKKVYIISRYRAFTERGREFNRKVARYFCRKVVLEGKQPIAPHLYYTQFLDDGDERERRIGTQMGIKELREADEFLLILIDGKISEGMYAEIREATKEGKRGRIICMTRKEIEEVME